MRITGRFIMAATLLMSSLATGACARSGAGTSHPTASTTPASWELGMAPSVIAAVGESADQTRLTIDLNMPAGLADHDCSRNLTGRVMDFSSKSALIEVTADMWTDPRCAHATTAESVMVKLPEPLGARTVNINSSALGDYIADPAGNTKLRFCYEFRCGPLPPATCDATSVRVAATGSDVDPHATWTVRSCDSHWLVGDFAWTGGPVCDNKCATASATTMRWFYRATEHGWLAITGTTVQGCTPIQTVDPTFPTASCRGLGRP
jgi:hypothetical protein